MRSPSERTIAIETIEATAEWTEAMMAVPFAKAIAMSKAISDKVETTAGQVATDKTPAAGTTIAISEAIAATAATMRSRIFTAQISGTARSINRTSTRGKNAARIHATRRLTIVSMKAIISSMMMPTLLVVPRAAAARAATAAMRARAAAMVVLKLPHWSQQLHVFRGRAKEQAFLADTSDEDDEFAGE